MNIHIYTLLKQKHKDRDTFLLKIIRTLVTKVSSVEIISSFNANSCPQLSLVLVAAKKIATLIKQF